MRIDFLTTFSFTLLNSIKQFPRRSDLVGFWSLLHPEGLVRKHENILVLL